MAVGSLWNSLLLDTLMAIGLDDFKKRLDKLMVLAMLVGWPVG